MEGDVATLFVAVVACGRRPQDASTPMDGAGEHSAATACPATESQTCTDPHGTVTGPDFQTTLASWCPEHSGTYSTWIVEAFRCEIPDGTGFDVIEAVWFGFDESTTWYAVPSGEPVAVERWADYNGFCCDTAFSYRRGPVPVDCLWRFEHSCQRYGR